MAYVVVTSNRSPSCGPWSVMLSIQETKAHYGDLGDSANLPDSVDRCLCLNPLVSDAVYYGKRAMSTDPPLLRL